MHAQISAIPCGKVSSFDWYDEGLFVSTSGFSFRFCLLWDDEGIVPYSGIRTAYVKRHHFRHRKMSVVPRRGGCPHPPTGCTCKFRQSHVGRYNPREALVRSFRMGWCLIGRLLCRISKTNPEIQFRNRSQTQKVSCVYGKVVIKWN